jgi:hypothetical protein
MIEVFINKGLRGYYAAVWNIDENSCIQTSPNSFATVCEFLLEDACKMAEDYNCMFVHEGKILYPYRKQNKHDGLIYK